MLKLICGIFGREIKNDEKRYCLIPHEIEIEFDKYYKEKHDICLNCNIEIVKKEVNSANVW